MRNGDDGDHLCREYLAATTTAMGEEMPKRVRKVLGDVLLYSAILTAVVTPVFMECLKSLSTTEKENSDFGHIGHSIVGPIGSKYTRVLFPDHWLVWVNIGLLTSMVSSITSAIGAFLLTRRHHSITCAAVTSLEEQAFRRFRQHSNSRFNSIYVATKLLPSLLIFSTLNFLLATLVWEICTSGVIVLLWLFAFLCLFFLVIPFLVNIFLKGKEAFKRKLLTRGPGQARRDQDDAIRRKMYETILASICRDIHTSPIPHMRIISALQLARSADFKNQATDAHWAEISYWLRRKFDHKSHLFQYSSDDIHLLEQILRSHLVDKPSPMQPAFDSYFHRIPPNNGTPDDAVNGILWTLLGDRTKDIALPSYEATTFVDGEQMVINSDVIGSKQV